MMGTLLSRALLLVFGYAYPAYECFKTLEKNNPELERLIFWCQYWIIVALLTAFERLGDTFISWLPLYSEAKLALFVYLWHPKTKGTVYLYDSFFRPYIMQYEMEIDHVLCDLRGKAIDIAVIVWHQAVIYGHKGISEILHHISSESASQTHTDLVPADNKHK